MQIKNVEMLKNVFYDFNSEIVSSVCDEIKREEYEQKNYAVWFYNSRNNRKSTVKVCDKKIMEEADDILEKYGREFLFYIWIEGDDHRINYFYKDIDTSTLNVHVIPGVIQHYVKREKGDVINSPLLVYNKQRLEMKEVPAGGKYLPFAEEIEEYLWVPTDANNDAIMNLQKIKEFESLSENLRNQLMEVRKDANSYLKEIEGVESSLRGGLGVKPKYTFIEWINAKVNGIPFSFDLMYVFYREGVGLLTAYDVINITPASEKEKGKETNVLNHRIENGTTVSMAYDVITDTKADEGVSNTHFRFENLYRTSNEMKAIIEKYICKS